MFTGRQSLPLKLADAFGGEREAVDWLTGDKGVPKNLPVRDYSPGAGFAGFSLRSMASGVVARCWEARSGSAFG